MQEEITSYNSSKSMVSTENLLPPGLLKVLHSTRDAQTSPDVSFRPSKKLQEQKGGVEKTTNNEKTCLTVLVSLR